MKSLSDWLSYLSQLHPKEMDLGLERIREVANRLKLLPLAYPAIVVGGTNGKGTTCHLLELIYRQAGYRTGLATSPHLLQFNERIMVNGNYADDAMICQVFAEIERARSEISLTYFEFSLLATLMIFQTKNIEIGILEVGLGGRLDAVNIIDAEVSAITTIDYDHMQWLGDTREQIGYEKAGIFRAGKSAICGDPNLPQTVIEHASKIGAALFVQGQDFDYIRHEKSWDWNSKLQSLKNLPMPAIPLQNASTALMIVQRMNALQPVDQEHITNALKKIQVLGRFQVIHRHCPVVLDVAHNPQSAELLAKNLSLMPCEGKTLAVFSALADKDCQGIIGPLADKIDTWFYSIIEAARAASKEQLSQCLHAYQHSYCNSIESAFNQALKLASDKDRIVVFGSFYVVAAILPLLN